MGQVQSMADTAGVSGNIVDAFRNIQALGSDGDNPH